MRKAIESIVFNMGSIESKSIPLEGKTLIVVGDNGSGKTYFLNKLNSLIRGSLYNTDFRDLETYENEYESIDSVLKKTPESSIHWKMMKTQRDEAKKKLDDYKQFYVELNDIEIRRWSAKNNEFLFVFFEAQRSYTVKEDSLLSSVNSLSPMYKNIVKDTRNLLNEEKHLHQFFERYLISMSTYSLILKGLGDKEQYTQVQKNIKVIESDLKGLFEFEGLQLKFNPKELKVELIAKNGIPMSLSKLSAGYSSILAIYSELLVHSEMSSKGKSNLEGIVIIDEIDAHLHVSLQKKILSFFTKAFPKIQFIVSTHSPFVLQSVSDALIYNISTSEVLEDLSHYTYSSIVKGLLGESTNSQELDLLSDELITLVKAKNINKRYKDILLEMESGLDNLDNKNKSLVFTAKNLLLDKD
ncbi:AAA family ATPase [Pantoea ananatis]|uniref:AAA family ATPase n=1 Tax=Pantoea ananas TaxID=553 RepID=UPI001B30AF60|nr:AAA family ATPase [Pantoea ananatis]